MTGRVFWIALAICVVTIMGILPLLLWRRKILPGKPLAMGALGFLAFAVIAESFFQMVCFSALGKASDALNALPWRLIAFSCLCAGLFEECGRFWIYRNGLASWRGRGTAVGYAIGHFAAELAIFTLWPLLSRPPAVFGGAECALLICERFFACAGHTALSVLVWKAFREDRKELLAAAIALHALCDSPLGMLNYGLLGPVFSRALFALGVTLIFLIALTCWQTMPAGVMMDEETGREGEDRDALQE